MQFLLIWYILFLKLIIYLAAASLVEAYLTVSVSPQVVGLVPCSTLLRMTEIFYPWVCNAVLCPCQGTGYHLVMSLDNKILCACQIWKGSERNIKYIICFQAGTVMNPTIRLVLSAVRIFLSLAITVTLTWVFFHEFFFFIWELGKKII